MYLNTTAKTGSNQLQQLFTFNIEHLHQNIFHDLRNSQKLYSHTCPWDNLKEPKTSANENKHFTLSGVDAPDVTPIVIGPFGRKFSFSTSSPYCQCNRERSVKAIRGRRSLVWDLHLRGAYRLFCCQDQSVAHCRSSKMGFHEPLKSPEGERCYLNSTHRPLAWGQSSLPLAHRLRLASPEKRLISMMNKQTLLKSSFYMDDFEILGNFTWVASHIVLKLRKCPFTFSTPYLRIIVLSINFPAGWHQTQTIRCLFPRI